MFPALFLYALWALCNDGPFHIHAASQLMPFRHIAAIVPAKHSGGVLADEQIVFPVTVVIARADNEPVIGVAPAASMP